MTQQTAQAYPVKQISKKPKMTFLDKLLRDKFLYLLALPGLLYFLVFKYLPIYGLIIAFKEYSPYIGIMESPWVGFEHFKRFFSYNDFWLLLRNTMGISLMNLFLFFPVPILLAVMLNEIANQKFKRTVQTIVYLPHFLSWVIIYGVTYLLFSSYEGLVNKIIMSVGLKSFDFLTNQSIFWLVVTIQSMWKEAGWGTVIFLASISGIDPSLYEAARMDGASRLKQIWHVTLPGIRNTIVVLLILRMGNIIDVSFDQLYLMGNAAVSQVAEVFDTYVYRTGINQGQYSYSAAIGFFKSIIGFTLVMITNKIAKSFGNEGVY